MADGAAGVAVIRRIVKRRMIYDKSRMDARTRCATVSTVTFAPGFRTDIDTLGRACRERGVLLLVDAAQSAGKVHTDVQRSNIDALTVSTQKGLLGLYGMGFLYVRREWEIGRAHV